MSRVQRIALDPSRAREELGWEAKRSFSQGLEETVRWYVDHQAWTERVTSGAYRSYYETQYRARLEERREPERRP